MGFSEQIPAAQAAARGEGAKSEPDVTTQQQLLLARLTKGVHW